MFSRVMRRDTALKGLLVLALALGASRANAQPIQSPWGEEPITRPSRNPPPPRPRRALSVSVADYTAPGEGRVAVAIESTGRPQSVVLEQRVDETNPDTHATTMRVAGAGQCVTPCRLFVPSANLVLRSDGPGLRSAQGTLDVPAEGLRIRVRAGSASLYNLGTTLTIGGATALVILAAVALVYQTGVASGEGPSSEAALGVGLTGGVLLAAGIPLMWLNRTGVEIIRNRALVLGAAWTF